MGPLGRQRGSDTSPKPHLSKVVVESKNKKEPARPDSLFLLMNEKEGAPAHNDPHGVSELSNSKAASTDEAEYNATPGDSTTQEGSASAVNVRPVFLGNLSPGVRSEDIMEIFSRPMTPSDASKDSYNPVAVDRVDIKKGFCFVFFKDAANAAERDQVERFVAGIQGMYVKRDFFHRSHCYVIAVEIAVICLPRPPVSDTSDVTSHRSTFLYLLHFLFHIISTVPRDL